MHRVPQTTAPRKQVSMPACDPIPLGQRRYRVPSSTNPCVSYIVDLTERTCGCPHFTHRQTPCKHMRLCEAAERAQRRRDGAEDTKRSSVAPAPAEGPQRGYFDEHGIYVGALGDAFDRPVRATRGGRR